MADAITTAVSPGPHARLPGLVLIASAIAMIVLLAMHPDGNARDFAGVLRDEAASRGIDVVVHGGFLLVLAVQMACYAVFSFRLTGASNAAIAGLVFFCFGAALQSGSVLIDGLVLPAIAEKYVSVPAKIETARALYVFGGTMISFLMPIGIGFQSAGIAAWGTGLLQARRRAAGLAGLAIGAIGLAAIITERMTKNPVFLMACIAGLALWAAVAGATLLRHRADALGMPQNRW